MEHQPEKRSNKQHPTEMKCLDLQNIVCFWQRCCAPLVPPLLSYSCLLMSFSAKRIIPACKIILRPVVYLGGGARLGSRGAATAACCSAACCPSSPSLSFPFPLAAAATAAPPPSSPPALTIVEAAPPPLSSAAAFEKKTTPPASTALRVQERVAGVGKSGGEGWARLQRLLEPGTFSWMAH